MIYDELSPYLKNRFASNRECPICHNKIDYDQEFHLIKEKRSKFMFYFFIHTNCIKEWLYNEHFSENKENNSDGVL